MANPRIISDTARGIRLKMVPGDITRPITDMVKGALFNIIGSDIVDTSMLDLFGGTGSVGLEALSRGAAFCRILDLNRPAILTIKANLETTHLKDNAQVIQTDAFSYLARAADRPFDFIFIAPPQYKGMWERALSILDAHLDWLNSDGWVIVQIDPKEYRQQPLLHLEEISQRRYGSTLLVFYEKAAEGSESQPPDPG